MAYATKEDVQARSLKVYSEDELALCEALLADAGIMIDAFNANAKEDVKKVVSCNMVIRAIGNHDGQVAPIGATQGSMSAMGYSQSWTINSGSVGELYLSKTDKKLLGVGNKIGSHSPLEDMQ